MITIVSGYTLARKSSMKDPEQIEWVPTSLCENMRYSSLKESIPDLIFLVVIWYNIWLSSIFPPIMCWLRTHLMSLGRNPLLWLYRPRFTLGTGIFLSATWSLSRSWHHSSMSKMSGAPCMPSVCSRWCKLPWVVYCITWCIPYTGCMLVYSPIWGL